ncbi:Maebl [Candidatus Burkholderia verschuerenii]|uniref:Maebl n=1 Tax=Candidatus Burkholderia verschuerenii TaxID=242163 RepID=A0A0L0MGW1_9BURK|nr:NYN domain-containing protein [Candidatus Burkholderia verschuerenii]KND61558.1 Maebl [Candidatus Burkholderia verschuerenii]
MPANQESVSMALFCDFENVALGVRDAKYEKFDIRPVLERLLLTGSIVVKKAYCDWDRYKGFKAAMHEASFEMIEIPHVRQSGKNSADIRLVVDALDLCYTKSHVDTFVIISGDSDFSPLVSKLRENAKKVIGVGVKHSTSDLLVANCDEFIFYDDLVREQQRAIAKREAREASAQAKRQPNEEKQPKQETDSRRSQAIAIAVETFEALSSERGESGKIWASVLKSAIKRRKPGFSETHYGFRAFGNLLDEAQSRGLLEVGRDDKNGSFVFRNVSTVTTEVRQTEPVAAVKEESAVEPKGKSRRRDDRRGRKSEPVVAQPVVEAEEAATPFPEAHAEPVSHEPVIEEASAPVETAPPAEAPARRKRKGAAKKTEAEAPLEASAEPSFDVPPEPKAKPKTPRKSTSRSSRARKTVVKEGEQ